MKFSIFKKYQDHILQMGALGFNLAFIMIVAYFLPIEVFGAFTYQYALASILAVICKFGLDSVFLYYYPRLGFKHTLSKTSVMFLVLTILFMSIGVQMPMLTLPIIFLAVVIAFDEILLAIQRAQYETSVFLGLRNFLLMSRIIVFVIFQDIPLLILCLVSQGISVLVFALFNIKRFKKTNVEDEITRKELDQASLSERLKFAIKNVISNLMGVLNVKSDIIMIGILLSFEHVGVYEIGARWGFLAFIPITIFSAVNASRISRLSKRKTLKFFDVYYKDSRKKVFLVTSVYTIILVVAQQMIGLFPDYFDAKLLDVGIILALGFCFSSFFGPSGTALVMLGYPGAHLARIFIALVVNVLLNLYLIPIYGAIGAAFATAAVVGMSGLASYLILRRVILINQ